MGVNAKNAKLYEAIASREEDVPAASSIKRTLEVVRTHLNMDVAYLSRFEGETSVLRDFAANTGSTGLTVGKSFPRAQTYSGNVADGLLPQVIPDTRALPRAAKLLATRELRIGCHIGNPIMLGGNEPWGMLCAYSFNAEPSLNPRDLSLVEAFSELVAFELNRERSENRQTEESRQRVSSVIEADDGMVALLQPIWELSRGAPWGAEALCRIVSDLDRGPEAWFAEADSVRMREDLELAAIRKALGTIDHLDDDCVLSINVSPATAMTSAFGSIVGAMPLDRILIELTEHLAVQDYRDLRAALAPLRGAGLRVAIDDAGGGYASMTHILQLQPDIIKADMALTRDIDSDKAKQALIGALADFATATRATLLAEGIETQEEFAEVRRLGVTLGQGYLLGRPARPADVNGAFACGAAAFRPSLSRNRAAAEAQVTDLSDILEARRRYSSAFDPNLGRWVV